jgi:hypothetical protein
MALSPQLQQFKSSGVYRLEFDKSQTVNIPAETIRLVVGRSKKGPYNTPVFIEDVEQFKQVFGGVDKSLEKLGMFFHRSAIETLSRGPILALNLTEADAEDRVAVVSPSTNSGEEGGKHIDLSVQYSTVFDTDKFWTPADYKLLATAGNTDETSNNAISFANIKQDPITIIVRQAANTSGFELTAREWYGEANIPEGIEELEYVSDYMVDVMIFKGKFDSALLNNDPTYGEMFENAGLIRSELSKFAALREVTLLASYTGSLIPDFMDNEGRQLYIETLINLEARRTGLFCAINEDALERIDLVGNNFNIYQDYQVLSHRVDQTVTSTDTAVNAVVSVVPEGLLIEGITVSEIQAAPYSITYGVNPKFLNSSVSEEWLEVTSIIGAGTADAVTGIQPNCIIQTTQGTFDKPSHESFDGDSLNVTPATWTSGDVTLTVDVDGALIISKNWAHVNDLQGALIPGNFLSSASNGEFVKIAGIDPAYGLNGDQLRIAPEGGEAFASSYDGLVVSALQPYVRKASTSINVSTINPNDRAVMFPSTATAWGFEDQDAGKFTFSYTGTEVTPHVWSDIKVGMYVPVKGGKLAKIKRKVKIVDGTTTKYEFQISRHIEDERPGYALKRYEESTDLYTMMPLSGATHTAKTIKELLTAIKPGTGLGNALIDRDNITFRYLVDTFGSLEGGTILNKEELTQVCKDRQNASAILNAPMVKELKKSTNPSFLRVAGDSMVFDVNTVATGGNLDLNPSLLYTLPSINEGANYGFYYGPGLNVMENGKVLVIPPAAYVSNNYIDKYTSALPWSIIAGPRRGVVGGTGVQGLEFAFDKNDRDVLEPFGYNPIVFERGVGLTIKGNKTAQQGIQSALSSAHVREAMIYIEDGLAEILKAYLFEFNTAQTRLEIKTLADNFMESVKKDQGVYDYRNIMDGTNNTNEVIDNNMGILDTYVEPVKGLEILVSRVTILNTGEIATGNFA